MFEIYFLIIKVFCILLMQLISNIKANTNAETKKLKINIKATFLSFQGKDDYLKKAYHDFIIKSMPKEDFCLTRLNKCLSLGILYSKLLFFY